MEEHRISGWKSEFLPLLGIPEFQYQRVTLFPGKISRNIPGYLSRNFPRSRCVGSGAGGRGALESQRVQVFQRAASDQLRQGAC